jgi:hypothetical protein
MANLRILYNNVADLATITASTTASGFAASNMQNAQKTSVHRSTGNTVTYTLLWAGLGNSQRVNGIALPATNLNDNDIIQVKLYDDWRWPASGNLVVSSNTTACSGRSTLLQGGETTTNYTQFSFGGASKTSIWFPQVYTIHRIEITLTSTSVSQIDCSRIVCGEYWEPTRQVDRGIELGFTDQSEITTTRSGNTYVDRKPIVETMNFQLQYLVEADRTTFMRIMRSWGTTGLIYACVFPDNTNPELTQAYSIYGRNQTNALQYQFAGYYSSSVQLNSW